MRVKTAERPCELIHPSRLYMTFNQKNQTLLTCIYFLSHSIFMWAKIVSVTCACSLRKYFKSIPQIYSSKSIPDKPLDLKVNHLLRRRVTIFSEM